MNAYWPRLALATLLLAGSLPAWSQKADGRSEEDVTKVARQWIAASEQGDRATVDRIVHPDYAGVSVKGAMQTKADIVDMPQPPAGSSQDLVDVHVSVFGDVAVMQGVNQYKPTPAARSVDVVFTDVYLYQEGHWRAIRSQATLRSSAP